MGHTDRVDNKTEIEKEMGPETKEWDINKQEYASHCLLKFCHRLCLDGPVPLFIFWKIYAFTANADLETLANTFVKVWDDSPHDIVQTTYVTIWTYGSDLRSYGTRMTCAMISYIMSYMSLLKSRNHVARALLLILLQMLLLLNCKPMTQYKHVQPQIRGLIWTQLLLHWPWYQFTYFP